MGLLVYKVADYSFTAEREQYRAICEMLKKHYSSRSEVCLFIANYSIYDSEIDGILFKNDAVISVESRFGCSRICTQRTDSSALR